MDAGRVVTLDAHHHQDGDWRRERTKMHDVTVLVLRLDLGFGAKGSSRWMHTSSTKMLDAHHHKNAEMHLGAKMQKNKCNGSSHWMCTTARKMETGDHQDAW